MAKKEDKKQNKKEKEPPPSPSMSTIGITSWGNIYAVEFPTSFCSVNREFIKSICKSYYSEYVNRVLKYSKYSSLDEYWNAYSVGKGEIYFEDESKRLKSGLVCNPDYYLRAEKSWNIFMNEVRNIVSSINYLSGADFKSIFAGDGTSPSIKGLKECYKDLDSVFWRGIGCCDCKYSTCCTGCFSEEVSNDIKEKGCCVKGITANTINDCRTAIERAKSVVRVYGPIDKPKDKYLYNVCKNRAFISRHCFGRAKDAVCRTTVNGNAYKVIVPLELYGKEWNFGGHTINMTSIKTDVLSVNLKAVVTTYWVMYATCFAFGWSPISNEFWHFSFWDVNNPIWIPTKEEEKVYGSNVRSTRAGSEGRSNITGTTTAEKSDSKISTPPKSTSTTEAKKPEDKKETPPEVTKESDIVKNENNQIVPDKQEEQKLFEVTPDICKEEIERLRREREIMSKYKEKEIDVVEIKQYTLAKDPVEEIGLTTDGKPVVAPKQRQYSAPMEVRPR